MLSGGLSTSMTRTRLLYSYFIYIKENYFTVLKKKRFNDKLKCHWAEKVKDIWDKVRYKKCFGTTVPSVLRNNVHPKILWLLKRK